MLGALISAGGALLGGVLGKSSADKARDASVASSAKARRQANMRGRADNRRQQRNFNRLLKREDRWNRKNIELQKQFAQSGVRWKVADARKAGVHPLYAMGAPTMAFNPVSVGGASLPGSSSPGYSEASFSPDMSMASALSSAGQDIGRAVSAMQSPQERLSNILTLENMGLQNELLRAQIMKTYAPGTGPGMPAVAGGPIPEELTGSARPHLRIGGKIPTHSSVSNAQDFEMRYGSEGPAAWFAGVPALVADTYKVFQHARDSGYVEPGTYNPY